MDIESQIKFLVSDNSGLLSLNTLSKSYFAYNNEVKDLIKSAGPIYSIKLLNIIQG